MAAPRCFIYCRTSPESASRERTRLDSQEAKCRAYAASRRWTVEGVWSDVGTGIGTERLPGLTALRNAVKRARVDALVVVRFDRLSREAPAIHHLMYEFATAGVQVFSVNEGSSKAFIPAGWQVAPAKEPDS